MLSKWLAVNLHSRGPAMQPPSVLLNQRHNIMVALGALGSPAGSRPHQRVVHCGAGGSYNATRFRDNKGGGGSKRVKEVEWRGPGSLREYKSSNGQQHMGTALGSPATSYRPFPGPPPDEGPPLRVLPVGGLGEIGMNCMLVGVRDRYILIDAGLMFPDFTDLGMQKILPDTSFLHQWKDKIEALVITHGHEDHIGAMPWVVPALDPNTPIYATSFVMKLIKKRMAEYSLFDEQRFRTFEMRQPFQAGPFEIEGIRVTHSIPDCCGLIMRSDEGTIVHTGDWKIDETPLDGQQFDRETFDLLGKEKVALFMSDSTNVLSPGRTLSEQVVHDSIVQKVLAHQNKGRVIITQFASNLARLYGVKAAADASGRKICFVGASLSHYLEAAWQDGRAPFDPSELMSPEDLKKANPNEVIIVSTGSQGEPNAQLTKASREQAQQLKILPNDLVLYSAKVIPGNEPQVSKMLNSLALQGARVVQGRGDNLHTSGHAYQDELKEVLRLVKPQHFLPVHGEYAFLTEHARLAKEQAGVQYCEVIRNGQMLGVYERSSRQHVSSGSKAKATIQVVGEASLTNYYNDGGFGTGTQQEMALEERTTLAIEGCVVVAVDLIRDGRSGPTLQASVRLTTRGMWTDGTKLKMRMVEDVKDCISGLPIEAPPATVERAVVDTVKRTARKFNFKKPEVICICHEHDPRLAHLPRTAAARGRAADEGPQAESRQSRGGRQGGAPRPWEKPLRVTRLGGDEEEPPSDSNDSAEEVDTATGPGPRSEGVQGDGVAAEGSTRRGRGRKSTSRDPEDGPRPRGRRASKSGSTDVLDGPAGPLRPVPESFMQARRAANPRDNNPADASPDSVAYD